MYVNKYYRKQVVELIKQSSKFVWVADNLSHFTLKISRVQFERIFSHEIYN